MTRYGPASCFSCPNEATPLTGQRRDLSARIDRRPVMPSSRQHPSTTETKRRTAATTRRIEDLPRKRRREKNAYLITGQRGTEKKPAENFSTPRRSNFSKARAATQNPTSLPHQRLLHPPAQRGSRRGVKVSFEVTISTYADGSQLERRLA